MMMSGMMNTMTTITTTLRSLLCNHLDDNFHLHGTTTFRLYLADSYMNCLVVGTLTMLLYPFVIIPISTWYLRKQRSFVIERHDAATATTTTTTTPKKTKKKNGQNSKANNKLPKDYWFVVWRISIIYCWFNANQLWYLSTYGGSDGDDTNTRVIWSMYDMTLRNTIVDFILLFVMKEFLTYGYHRLVHSNRYLYKTLHYKHHMIHHCGHHYHHDDDGAMLIRLYDGFYGNFPESCIINVINFVPIILLNGVHITTALTYITIQVIVGVVINHSGRHVVISIPSHPWFVRMMTNKSNDNDNDNCNHHRWILYDSQHHDDHHLYHKNNYADIIPIFDQIFGTLRPHMKKTHAEIHVADKVLLQS